MRHQRVCLWCRQLVSICITSQLLTPGILASRRAGLARHWSSAYSRYVLSRNRTQLQRRSSSGLQRVQTCASMIPERAWFRSVLRFTSIGTRYRALAGEHRRRWWLESGWQIAPSFIWLLTTYRPVSCLKRQLQGHRLGPKSGSEAYIWTCT